MKKFSSVLLALVMLFALCIPAFAGDGVAAQGDSVALFAEADASDADKTEDESDSASESVSASDADASSTDNTSDDLGISTFDPSGALDNIVDGISDNDLSGLFGTLRNTINDLSGRLSGVFKNIGGNNNGGTDDNSNGNSNGDDTFGGSEPTGDTAIYAVAGVAVVAAAALIFTKKKSEKAE